MPGVSVERGAKTALAWGTVDSGVDVSPCPVLTLRHHQVNERLPGLGLLDAEDMGSLPSSLQEIAAGPAAE